MVKKQAYHVEWGGRLLLTGQSPIITGAAIGSTQLMWVACRTCECLVHVFQDSHRVSIWRFPSDPVCLLFCPRSMHQAATSHTGEERKGDISSSAKITVISLLVITLDGGIWKLDVWDDRLPSHERPAKKRREVNSPGNLLTRVSSTTSVSGAEGISSLPPSSRQKQGDVASAIGGDEDCYFSSLKCQWRKQAIRTHGKYSKKKCAIRLVSVSNLLGVLPSVSVAGYGPDDTVALLGGSGTLNMLHFNSSHPTTMRASLAACADEQGSKGGSKEPTCILFATVMLEIDSVPPVGNVAILSKNFFDRIFNGEVYKTSHAASKGLGLLQGDKNGYLYGVSVPSSHHLENIYTRVLCDIEQPVAAIFVVPFNRKAGENIPKPEQKDSLDAQVLQGDSILVLGQLGRVILIRSVQEESNEVDNGPFLPTRRTFSWKPKSRSSKAATQLATKGFMVQEWDVKSPITSACMLGAGRLCYCSGSEILYVDLFERVRVEGGARPGKPPPGVVTGSTTFPSFSEPASRAGLQTERIVLKEEELASLLVPVADVVSIVGRGGVSGGAVVGGSTSSRPVVALTSRGRLLGVEVSDHVSEPTFGRIDINRSWRSLTARRDEQVQTLLQAVSEVTECTQSIKRQLSSMALALRELASAFPLLHDICSDHSRNKIYPANLSQLQEVPQRKLWCSLMVVFCPSASVLPETLSFDPGRGQNSPTNYPCRMCEVKIPITLHNQTPFSLSPYWSLLLEIRSLGSEPTDASSTSYSTVINKGLGLPGHGAHFSHDFFVRLPSTSYGPFLASVFICHLSDPHQTIIWSNFPQGKIHAQTLKRYHTQSKMMPDNGRKSLQTKIPLEREDMPAGEFGDDISHAKISGSVCLLLNLFRIDLLSLVEPQPLASQSSTSSLTYLKVGGDKHKQVDSSSNNLDHLLGVFSGSVGLSSTSRTALNVSSDVGKVWRELHLDDLLQKGLLTKAADGICFSAPDDSKLSLSISRSSAAEGKPSVLMVFQAASLLIGSLARESLLWRLNSPDEAQLLAAREGLPGRPLSGSKTDLYPDVSSEERFNEVSGIVRQLKAVSRRWKNTPTPDSAVEPLLKDSGAAVGAILKLYRAHRDHPSTLCSISN